MMRDDFNHLYVIRFRSGICSWNLELYCPKSIANDIRKFVKVASCLVNPYSVVAQYVGELFQSGFVVHYKFIAK